MAENKRQYNENMALQREQFAWQKAQAAKASSSSSISRSRGSSSGKSSSSKKSSTPANGFITQPKSEAKKVSAYDYLNKLISSGATKDKVANEIALALRNKEITAKEAQKLRSTFTPRGLQY